MASITQLGYLGPGVSDLTAWEDYAIQVLGLSVSARANDGTLFLRMDEYHHRCILHPHGDDDVAYIGWEVADAHALEAVAAQVQAAGTAVTQGTADQALARRVAEFITVQDPNGIALEIFYGPLVQLCWTISNTASCGPSQTIRSVCRPACTTF